MAFARELWLSSEGQIVWVLSLVSECPPAPAPVKSTGFSCLSCENLVGFLEVKLIRSVGTPFDSVSLGWVADLSALGLQRFAGWGAGSPADVSASSDSLYLPACLSPILRATLCPVTSGLWWIWERSVDLQFVQHFPCCVPGNGYSPKLCILELNDLDLILASTCCNLLWYIVFTDQIHKTFDAIEYQVL